MLHSGRSLLAIPSREDTLNSATKQKIPFLELQKKKKKKKGNGNKAKSFWGPDPDSSAKRTSSSRLP